MSAIANDSRELIPVLREDLFGVLEAAQEVREALGVLVERLDAAIPEPDAKPDGPKLRGRRQPIAMALPPELIAELDAMAAAQERSRAKMLEILLRGALERARADA